MSNSRVNEGLIIHCELSRNVCIIFGDSFRRSHELHQRLTKQIARVDRHRNKTRPTRQKSNRLTFHFAVWQKSRSFPSFLLCRNYSKLCSRPPRIPLYSRTVVFISLHLVPPSSEIRTVVNHTHDRVVINLWFVECFKTVIAAVDSWLCRSGRIVQKRRRGKRVNEKRRDLWRVERNERNIGWVRARERE